MSNDIFDFKGDFKKLDKFPRYKENGALAEAPSVPAIVAFYILAPTSQDKAPRLQFAIQWVGLLA